MASTSSNAENENVDKHGIHDDFETHPRPHRLRQRQLRIINAGLFSRQAANNACANVKRAFIGKMSGAAHHRFFFNQHHDAALFNGNLHLLR